MKRTVTRDVELGGRQLREGDRALLLYESANFDEAQFDEPDRFDMTRSPNDHIAFGFGAHFCLGAHLARLELQTVFERILARLPDLELAHRRPPPRSITGISEMPVRFTPTRVGGRRRGRERAALRLEVPEMVRNYALAVGLRGRSTNYHKRPLRSLRRQSCVACRVGV